jgi:hypothetical protein
MEIKETLSLQIYPLQIYLEPVFGTFNVYPFNSKTVTDSPTSTVSIVDEYLKRYSKAWDELAKK